MKKGAIIAVVCAAAAILGLGGLAVYLTLHFGDRATAPAVQKAESEADAAFQALYDTADLPNNIEETQRETEDRQILIWAGDSRTLGMRDAMKNGDLYIGASGEGYDWLREEGLPQIGKAIASHPGTPVIFNFGVNDYDNMERYLALYASLAEEYPDTPFYFLAVYPIDPERCSNITNEEIADFNAHLKELFPDTYLDSYNYLMAEGMETTDGIHYNEEDYRKLYEFAEAEVQKRQNAS